jgi:hypothetical protein
VDVGHGGHGLRGGVRGRGEGLVAHGDGLDLRGGVVCCHVVAHPRDACGDW